MLPGWILGALQKYVYCWTTSRPCLMSSRTLVVCALPQFPANDHQQNQPYQPSNEDHCQYIWVIGEILPGHYQRRRQVALSGAQSEHRFGACI